MAAPTCSHLVRGQLGTGALSVQEARKSGRDHGVEGGRPAGLITVARRLSTALVASPPIGASSPAGLRTRRRRGARRATGGAGRRHAGRPAWLLLPSIKGHHAIVVRRTSTPSTQVTLPHSSSLFLSLRRILHLSFFLEEGPYISFYCPKK